MKSKSELQEQAKSLLEKSPEEAMEVCKKLWSAFPEGSSDAFNLYDALQTLKATKNNSNVDFDFVYKVTNLFKNNDQVSTSFGWFMFNNHLKGARTGDYIEKESTILKMFEILNQIDLSTKDELICPYTIGCIGLAKDHSKNLFNANRIESLLNLLDPQFLSGKSSEYTNSKGKTVKLASDFETYYALKTKALLKLESYEECIALCKEALSNLKEFHYNNELWFRFRIAVCYEKLGEFEKSERLFYELISTKEGSDKWFIYKDIAELYFEQEDFEKAWRFAVDAGFYGFDLDKMNGLFLLQARILFKLDRAEEGILFACLIAAVINKEGYKIKEDYNKLFKFYKIDLKEQTDLQKIYRKCKNLWITERYKDFDVNEGVIVFVHPNKKVGKIRMEDNTVYDFHKRDFYKKQGDLIQLKNSKVSFVKMNSFNGELVAENIKVLEKKKGEDIKSNLVGQKFSGKIKNITDFGLFVRLEEKKDGLLHKNNLPSSIKDSFKEKFGIGENLNVRVIKVTEKGIELKLEE